MRHPFVNELVGHRNTLARHVEVPRRIFGPADANLTRDALGRYRGVAEDTVAGRRTVTRAKGASNDVAR